MPYITAKEDAGLSPQPNAIEVDSYVIRGGQIGIDWIKPFNADIAQIRLAGPYTYPGGNIQIPTGAERYLNKNRFIVPNDAWVELTQSTQGPSATSNGTALRQTEAPNQKVLPSQVSELNHYYESCILQAYPDPASGGEPITIGWGNTFYEDGSKIQLGDVLTQGQADALYSHVCYEHFWIVLASTIPYWEVMSDYQRAALCSFAYNNGAGFYKDGHHNTISRNLAERDWKAVPGSMMMYRYPRNLSVVVGLGRRRRAEGLVWTGVSPSKACRQAEQEINSAADCERFEQQLKGNPPDIRSNSSNNSVRSPSNTLTSRTSNLGLWLPPLGVDDFTLPVNHYTQIDNTGGEGFRECFMTSCTMLADYLTQGRLTKERQEKGLAEPEDAYYKYMDGDTTDSSVHIRALKTLGIDAYFSTTASIKDVESALDCGIPVPIGVQYSVSGHWVLVNGRGPKGWDVLCPNGIRDGASNNWIQRFQRESEAKPDTFSWNLLKQIFVDQGPEAGWTIFVTAVNGISTGVRKGM